MSYPDLGCFAECLTCEICDPNWLGAPPLDLTLPDNYDPWSGDPFAGWEPEPDEEGGLWDDFETPGVDLPGGGRATPDWDNGPGIDLTWPF
jgi:hypothetical protein